MSIFDWTASHCPKFDILVYVADNVRWLNISWDTERYFFVKNDVKYQIRIFTFDTMLFIVLSVGHGLILDGYCMDAMTPCPSTHHLAVINASVDSVCQVCALSDSLKRLVTCCKTQMTWIPVVSNV